MNNFWIPEELNLNLDRASYEGLTEAERFALKMILADFSHIDSIQSANLPNLQVYVTANEINLCLSIQTYQEAIHSKAYSYILEAIADREEIEEILGFGESDEKLKARVENIGHVFNEFLEKDDEVSFVKNLITNYIVEGISFYTGYAFIYNLGRNSKMPGTVDEIRHIHRDEDKHLQLYKNIINDFRAERADLFTAELVEEYKEMIKDAVLKEIDWAKYIISDEIAGLDREELSSYLRYLGNERSVAIGFGPIFDGYLEIPQSLSWINREKDPNKAGNMVKVEAETTYKASSFIEDDL